MPGEPAPIALPVPVLREVFREARRAYPAECCGWLVGSAIAGGPAVAAAVRTCANQQLAGDHPTAAERGAETAYVIAGEDLLAFNRAFDSGAPPIAIYHSHPNAGAYFSATDRAVAASPWGDGPAYPVQQLVVGLDRERVTAAALFAWSHEASDFVEIARFPGAEL